MCVFSVGCVLRGSYCKISTNFVVNVEIVRRTKGQSPNSKVQTPKSKLQPFSASYHTLQRGWRYT